MRADEDVQRERQAAAGRARGGKASGKLQVLVVEDNAFNRKYVACLLESAGFAVSEAHHGAAALQILDLEHFDVVVMDLNMPIMDGLTATRYIRKSFPLLCIIALTSGSAFGESECIAAGCDVYLRKPIRKEQLCEAVVRTLAVVGARDSALPIDGGGAAASSELVRLDQPRARIRPAPASCVLSQESTTVTVCKPAQRGADWFDDALVYVGRGVNDQVLAELATEVTDMKMRVEKREVALDDLQDGQHWAERALEVLEKQMRAANERIEELDNRLNRVQDRQEEGSERTTALESLVDTLAGDQHDLRAYMEHQELALIHSQTALQANAAPAPGSELQLEFHAPAVREKTRDGHCKPLVAGGSVRGTSKG